MNREKGEVRCSLIELRLGILGTNTCFRRRSRAYCIREGRSSTRGSGQCCAARFGQQLHPPMLLTSQSCVVELGPLSLASPTESQVNGRQLRREA
jgi:hypothetical protein